MKTQFYFPAPVEVVKVTNENLAEVAEWCGGKVASTESRKVPGRMDSYVWVPTPKGNAVSWAFPGMFITKRMVVTVKDEMKATYAVFRKDYFSRNYFDTPSEAVDKTWEKGAKKKQANKPKVERVQEADKVDAIAQTVEAMTKTKVEFTIAGAEKLMKETEKFPEPVTIVEKFRHHHNINSECVHACPDRYVDGIHIFNDTRINTIENPYPNQPHIKENDMERSKHGYPILTEEEAAAKKADNGLITQTAGEPIDDGITMAQAVETVKEIIPGSEIIEETDEGDPEIFRQTLAETAESDEQDVVNG